MGEDEYQLVRRQLFDLASDRPEAYQTAFDWFVERGPAITTALIGALDDEQFGSVGHGRILRLLGEFGEEPALPAILKALSRALGRRDHIVIPAAMNALGAFHGPEITDTLIGLLQESDPDIVKHAARLLGQTGDMNAIEPLVGLLGAEDSSIRYSAARALVQTKDPSARAALKKHLENETNTEVRQLIESAVKGGPGESGL